MHLKYTDNSYIKCIYRIKINQNDEKKKNIKWLYVAYNKVLNGIENKKCN